MMSSFGLRQLQYATLALILLASAAHPTTAIAQETVGPVDITNAPPPQSDAIGPPQLRGFELPGNRVIPARPQATPPAAVAPPVEPPAPKVAPVQRQDAPPDVSPVTQSANVPTPDGDESRAAEAETPSVQAPPAPLAEPNPPPAPLRDIEAPTPTQGGFSWAYALAVALAGGLLGLLFWYRRRPNRQKEIVYELVDGGGAATVAPAAPLLRKPTEPEATAVPLRRDLPPAPEPVDEDPPAFLVRTAPPTATPGTAPNASPRPASPSPHDGVVGVQIRPWLELQFKPDRATATATEAAVQFELVIANTGNVVASNIRLDARMFNPGTHLEREIEAYFAAPIQDRIGGSIPDIQPRSVASLRSVVSMPKQHVREIEVNGRRLFIPTVAITVCYEWANGKTGRTSMSFLVGREPETPSSKMSPFRLDQGPRVYRQVGQRPSQPAVLV